ncbi:dioxygenase family protein [Mycobacterium antarcticum]|uniref:dioxygenase family protein n=1 Tax=Mycolicibacterium sp. TUM20985 TaxID=3023370 RepID=UPI002572E99C|nr:hypothetical protein [Mycolicibacterium sp. TUM20985]
MPALFLSHGAPPLVEDERWVSELAGWSARLPRPKAILVVSAHWDPTPNAVAPGWSREFDAWAAECFDAGDLDALIDFRGKAPGMPYAHPTIEHFAPLFVALGTSADPEQVPKQVVDGFWMGLAKRSVELS